MRAENGFCVCGFLCVCVPNLQCIVRVCGWVCVCVLNLNFQVSVSFRGDHLVSWTMCRVSCEACQLVRGSRAQSISADGCGGSSVEV